MLPPLIASAAAAGKARRGGDPFALLIADHREISGLLDDMASQGPDSTARRSASFLMLKRKLAKHAMAEEDVVYPILHNQGQDGPESKHLYDEHADMKILLFELEQCLMSGDDWSGQVHKLRDLIMHHVEEEERDVFPRLRQMLDEKRTTKMSGQISREEALVL
jgi:hemerythrin superfamily protein